MICLATDYTRHNPGGLWWQDHNILQYSRGESFETLRPVEEWESPRGFIWTAPSVFFYKDKVYVMAGINADGPRPDQRLYMFELGNPHIPIGHPPSPLKHMTYMGAAAWRDAIVWKHEGGLHGANAQTPSPEWLMSVTTGGFRWGSHPNVILFEAYDPLGKWDCLGPIIDPSISALYAEMERPQLHFYGGRWVAWWSAWPTRHFTHAPMEAKQHVYSSAGDFPIISRTGCNLSGAYGMIRWRYWCAGWNWTDLDAKRGDVAVWSSPDLLQRIGHELEITA
jgi:hypothetical protein